jgi:hypothetical protein
LESAQRMTCQHGTHVEATAELERYCKHDATNGEVTSTENQFSTEVKQRPSTGKELKPEDKSPIYQDGYQTADSSMQCHPRRGSYTASLITRPQSTSISEKCTTCDIAAANNGNESREMDDNNSTSNPSEQCTLHEPAEATADQRPDRLTPGRQSHDQRTMQDSTSSLTAKTSVTTKASRRKRYQPPIVDTNQRVPILINSDDSGDPYRFGGDTELDTSGDEQDALPANRKKRLRPEGPAGSVSWADRDFE